MDDDYELITSPLSQFVTRDDYTVEVCIYRGPESQWILEVVDERGGSTVWNEQFPTDEAAFSEFEKTLDEEGIRSFES